MDHTILQDAKSVALLETLKSDFQSIAWNPDSKTFASSDESTIKIWNKKTQLWNMGRTKVYKTLYNESNYTQLAFSPNGKILVAGNSNGTIKFWDYVNYKNIQTITSDKSEKNQVLAQ